MVLLSIYPATDSYSRRWAELNDKSSSTDPSCSCLMTLNSTANRCSRSKRRVPAARWDVCCEKRSTNFEMPPHSPRSRRNDGNWMDGTERLSISLWWAARTNCAMSPTVWLTWDKIEVKSFTTLRSPATRSWRKCLPTAVAQKADPLKKWLTDVFFCLLSWRTYLEQQRQKYSNSKKIFTSPLSSPSAWETNLSTKYHKKMKTYVPTE